MECFVWCRLGARKPFFLFLGCPECTELSIFSDWPFGGILFRNRCRWTEKPIPLNTSSPSLQGELDAPLFG